VDAYSTWKRMDNDENLDKVPKMISMAFASAITNQTFLQGITNVVNAISDPTRFAPKLLGGFAGSLVPNVIGQPTGMMDDKAREIYGMVDAIKARLPGFRETLPIKVDYLGEEIPSKERVGGIFPVNVQKVSDDLIRQEMKRLNITIPNNPKTLRVVKGAGKYGEIELTPEQKDIYARTSGAALKPMLDTLVHDPQWEALPDVFQVKLIQKFMKLAHKQGAYFAVSPEDRERLVLDAVESMTEDMQPKRSK